MSVAVFIEVSVWRSGGKLDDEAAAQIVINEVINARHVHE